MVNLKSTRVGSYFHMKIVNSHFYPEVYKCSFICLVAVLKCALLGRYLGCHPSGRGVSLYYKVSTSNNCEVC